MKNIPENTSKNTHNVVFQLLSEEQNMAKVLDIPCGAGAFTQRLLQKGITVYSGDIENILQIKNDHFAVADMNLPLPFENNFFDAIVCIDGIEHLENPFLFVRECFRSLRAGGVFIVSTPNISAMRSRWRWLMTGHHNKCKLPLDENNPNPLHHINMFSFPRLRYILHSNGFNIIKTTTNRIKTVSWLYVVLMPFSRLRTQLVYRKEKNKTQRALNRQVLKTMFSKSVYFGETIIVKAVKQNT